MVLSQLNTVAWITSFAKRSEQDSVSHLLLLSYKFHELVADFGASLQKLNGNPTLPHHLNELYFLLSRVLL